MHFILSTFGSAGDVFPNVALALELRRRGHQLTLATNPYFAELIESYGLAFEPLGTVKNYHACISDPNLWNPGKSFAHMFGFLKPVLKRQFDIHAERSGENVVGISSCMGFGALMAQDAHQIPVITMHLQPAVIWSDIQPPGLPGMFGPKWLQRIQFRIGERFVIDPVVCPFLNAWRVELGLPPVKNIVRWWNSKYGILCLFPDWYCTPQTDWPQPVLQADFPLWNHQSDAALADELQTFLDAGDPPIVFTPGTANAHGREFFAAAVQTCQTLKRRGILLTKYVDQIPPSLPSSIAHFNYVPLDRLLPRSAAFVHHGGVGSTSQGLLAGIPQVLMPLAHDQFDNAQRIEKLNAGASLPATRFNARRLTDLLKPLLSSDEVATVCQGYASRLAARDGIALAADAIERRVGVETKT
ncbi:glycosyltransferase [Planctomicrobium piriforme]|nr:nucleotide disphospho-sugar-binding domain-containing protein [Planctomicrobium piriforme]